MNKKLKVLFITLICVVILFISAYFIVVNIVKNKIVEQIDEVFIALKSGDIEKIKEYVDLDDLSKLDDEKVNNILLMFKSLNYEIKDIELGINQCTIILDVSNKNVKNVLSSYITNLAYIMLSKDQTKVEAYKLLEEQYNMESEILHNEIYIFLVREGTSYKTKYDKLDLLNAILPGYNEIIEYLKNI